jgi:hypothetical protein
VEHVCSTFEKTDPVYLAYMERRLCAATLWWAPNVGAGYRSEPLERFLAATSVRLASQCRARGVRSPTRADLRRMRIDGGWPDESRVRTHLRHARFSVMTAPRRVIRRLRSL